MKKSRLRFFALFSISLMIFTLFSCGSTPEEEPEEIVVPEPVLPQSVTVVPAALELTEGETAGLSAKVSPSDAEYSKITYSSSDSLVAKVSESGVVTAVSQGSATITVSADSVSAKVPVTVLHLTVYPESITATPAFFELTEGESAALKAEVNPLDAEYSGIVFSSSNPLVAEVSESGTVTAVKRGTAEITIRADDVFAVIPVTVVPRIIDIETEGQFALLAEGTDGTCGPDGVYATFGMFPQTVKADDIVLSEEPEESGYYRGDDGCLYTKLDSASPYHAYAFSNGEKIAGDTVYYFKMEPIKWRVLSDDYEGGKLLSAENVLINMTFYPNYRIVRTIEEESVQPNNYEHSMIRAYLNGLSFVRKYSDGAEELTNSVFEDAGFLQAAFTQGEQEHIALTDVDNSEATTADFAAALEPASEYVSADTQDKIFLLSLEDVTNPEYGFAGTETDDPARYRTVTDYARAIGAWTSVAPESDGTGRWWLRSPYGVYFNFARAVFREDLASVCYYVNLSDVGVVPALVYID